MRRLRDELRSGVLGQGWRDGSITIAMGLIATALSLVYDGLNHGPNALFLRTTLDDALPVVPILVVPYVTLRPLVYVSALVFLLFRVRIYRSAALSMSVTFLVSYAFYVFLQSYIARPDITGTDTFSAMIRDVYASDQPYNDFPSLHASLATLFAFHWWRVDRRIGIAVGLWAVLIVLSTVFVKQHYLADMVAGVVLGGGVSLFFLRTARSWANAPVGPAIADRSRSSAEGRRSTIA